MSRYIATRAIRGANALVSEAETMLKSAIADKGAEHAISFPNTAYYLPLIYGMTNIPVENLGQLDEVLKHARELLHPLPANQHWTPYLGETLDSGMATLYWPPRPSKPSGIPMAYNQNLSLDLNWRAARLIVQMGPTTA